MTAVRLLDRLEAMKGQFGADAAARTAELLERLAGTRIRGAEQLIRLHETVLFLRAYPPGPRALRAADRLLFAFGKRIDDAGAFADPQISGVAGSELSAVFSHEVARRLGERHGRAIGVDWEGYEAPDSFGAALARRLPLFADDWPVEANIPYRQWLGRRGLPWLTANLDADAYEALRLPLLWKLGASRATRSRTRWAARRIFYHAAPLLRRSEISLEAELAGPPLAVERLPVSRANRLLEVILDTSAVRYRELYGFTWPDRARVFWADAGRGLGICFFGVPPERRLPLRAYHAGMFFKNGVPVGYLETLSLFERAEVGFNLYYTFREGETAWLYARTLRLLRQLLGVTAFSVDPYQVGLHNEEAIESGAFWFYRKLGFRPLSAEGARLAEREEERMRAAPGYRTAPGILRRLARSGLMYHGGPEWDRFSVRQLGMRLAETRDGPAGWPGVFAAIGDFARWPREEQRAAGEIVRAKSLPTETRYLRLLQRHRRLRAAVLKLGSA
ncbi:MAG: hypothetical protein ABSC23_19665 [Bryobacteraceae bacterium]|jgi:hypothetical protein